MEDIIEDLREAAAWRRHLGSKRLNEIADEIERLREENKRLRDQLEYLNYQPWSHS